MIVVREVLLRPSLSGVHGYTGVHDMTDGWDTGTKETVRKIPLLSVSNASATV